MVFYENMLREAKEYLRSIEVFKEKIYHAGMKMLTWFMGMNAFLIYHMWGAQRQSEGLLVLCFCGVFTLCFLWYGYKLFFGIQGQEVEGTEPRAFYHIEDYEEKDVYIEYINDYQERIDRRKDHYSYILKQYKMFRGSFLLFVFGFVVGCCVVKVFCYREGYCF